MLTRSSSLSGCSSLPRNLDDRALKSVTSLECSFGATRVLVESSVSSALLLLALFGQRSSVHHVDGLK